MFPYRMVIEWSKEDESYVGRVPALPGCLGFGSTVGEAAAETQTGAEGILAAMREHGRPIPPPDTTAGYSGQLRLRLPRDLHRSLAQLAMLEDVSLNQLMVHLLSQRQVVQVATKASDQPPAPGPDAHLEEYTESPAERQRRTRAQRVGSPAIKRRY